MIEIILDWLEDIGLVGLFVAMFLEGSSLPFPGIAVVLAYGYILPFSYWNTFLVATGMSFVYCCASLLPYYIGKKFEGHFLKDSRKGLQKAKDIFIRYGAWSVAMTRPFGLGNYISYVAGISKMKLSSYLLLTFLGIYPWSFVMILLGNYFNGSYEAFKAFYQANSMYLYLSVSILVGIILFYFIRKNKRNAETTAVKAGGNEHV
ncbi:DedA family protein [Fredinandcohnia humi]